MRKERAGSSWSHQRPKFTLFSTSDCLGIYTVLRISVQGFTCPPERLLAFRSEGRKRKVHGLAGKSYQAQTRIAQYLRYRNSRVARTVVYQATRMASVSAV